jgi:RimJ/RimL family protein N-acetyltransferase
MPRLLYVGCMFGPRLSGTGLTLRAFRLSDAPYFRRWFADPDVVRYWWLRDVPWARSPNAAALVLFARAACDPEAMYWTIERDGRPIGHTNIRQIDRAASHAVSSMFIGEKCEHGKGLAGDAIALRNAYLFHQFGLNKIKAIALSSNHAIHRVFEKAGYRLVGTVREDVWVAGRRHDVLLFELLRADWEQSRVMREQRVA